MDQQALLNRIAVEFPDLKWSTVKNLTIGWDHYVLLLDDTWVFRFPHGADNQANFATEPALLNALRDRLPVAIPRYEYVAADKSFGGYRLLPGRIYSEDELRGLPKSEQLQLARQLGESLRALHGIPAAEVAGLAEQPTDTEQDAAEFRKEVENAVFPKITADERVAITDCLDAYQRVIMAPRPSVLVHHDVSADHVLVEDGQVVGIIDWSDRGLNDPAWDFAYLVHISEDFAAACIQAYGLADETLFERTKVYAFHIIISGLRSALGDAPLTFDEALADFRAYLARLG